MNHVLKVIIGFTVMIGLGVGALYFIDKSVASNNDSNIKPINTGAGCAAKGNC